MKKLTLLNFLFGSLFMLSAFISSGATITSKASGSWDNTSTWDSGSVPTSSDTVVIAVGDSVSIATTPQYAKSLTINATDASNYGTLTITAGATLNTTAKVTVNGKLYMQGGTFNEGDGAGDYLYISGSYSLISISGGTLNTSRYFNMKNNATFIMSGGNLNINSSGGTSGTDIFYVPTGSTFTMSAGTINILNGNLGAGNALKFNPTTSNVTGGTIQFTNAKGYSATTMSIGNSLYDVVCDVKSGDTLIIRNETSPSSVACHNFTITSGVTQINPGAGLTVNGTLTNSGTAANLVIASDATGNGSLKVTGSVTGDATVQRYIAAFSAVGAADGWHEIGCPVSSYSVSGTDWDPTATGTNNDLYYWDESQNLWMNYRTATFDFSAGNGYLAANDANLTHVFTGTLNNADIPVSGLSYTSGQGNGWHLLGNPFPSALTWGDANWSLSNVAGTAKIWNEGAGNYSDISSGGIIPSTNGFLVQVSSSTNSLTIPVADRVHDATNNFKSSSEQPKKTLKIKVTNDANDYYDVSTLGFKSEATADYDLAFDSHKLFGLVSTAPSLYTVSKNQKFSTDYLSYSNENIEVPLSFKAGINGTYHLTFSGIDSFDANSSITLEDLFTGKTVDVRKNQTYSYTAAKEDAPNRFVLHFYNVTSTPEIGEANNKAIIYSYNNNIIVKATDKQLNGKVEIINILGQTMETKSVSNINFFTINTNLNKGVYIVRYIETDGYTQAQKVIIN